MIAKVIVDVASKSVDYKFDYLIPERLVSVIQPGIRVVVPFGPRTIQGYVMEVTTQPDSQLDMSKLKSIIEVKDIKPELTPELIALSEWMSATHVIKRISMLEVMLPSAIKAKYKKAFMLKDDTEVTADILKRFDKNGFYYYKDAQKNNDIASLMSLLQAGIIEEKTILSQNVTKKTKRAVRIIDGFNPDEVLAKLEKIIKQYDLYAFLSEEQHKTIFLSDIEDMGFSKSSLDGLVKKDMWKSMTLSLKEIHLKIVFLSKNQKDSLRQTNSERMLQLMKK